MYEPHPAFMPPQIDMPLWRYLDMTKFLGLLEGSKLHFTRPDHFDDPFEGVLPAENVRSIKKANEDWVTQLPAYLQDAIRSNGRGNPVDNYVFARKVCGVLCLHANEHESAAMWHLYCGDGQGIAIRTTFERLTKSFGTDENTHVYGGCVNYIDYSKDTIPVLSNIFYPILYKRRSFEHEKEVRIVGFDIPAIGTDKDDQMAIPAFGFDLPVNLEMLIESVYVSPTTPTWVQGLIGDILRRYGLSCEVKKSSLNDKPLW